MKITSIFISIFIYGLQTVFPAMSIKLAPYLHNMISAENLGKFRKLIRWFLIHIYHRFEEIYFSFLKVEVSKHVIGRKTQFWWKPTFFHHFGMKTSWHLADFPDHHTYTQQFMFKFPAFQILLCCTCLLNSSYLI